MKFRVANQILAIAVILMTAKRFCAMTCIRRPSLVRMGFDGAQRLVDVDVGLCVSDQTLEPCNETTLPSCACATECVSEDLELRSYNNRSGPFMSEVIGSCANSVRHCGDCERHPQIITVFPDSFGSYKKTIDRGVCVGNCNDNGHSCVAVRRRNVAVEEPNGATLVNVVMECGCRNSKCYKEDYFVSYSEVVTLEEENGTVTVMEKEKIINIGRCSGNCGGVKTPATCYPSPELCLIRVGGRQARCAPASATVHNFVDSKGTNHSVVSVNTCECLPA